MSRYISRGLLMALLWVLFRHTPHRTNATFFRPATLQLHAKEQRPARWHWLSGYQRMAVKFGVFLGLPALFLWAVTDPWLLVAVVVVLIGTVAAVAFRNVRRNRVDAEHVRTNVEPLHWTLRAVVGEEAPQHWRDWLDVPADFREEGTDGVRVELPAELDWPADRKQAIADAVRQKTGISDLTVTWSMTGADSYVTFRPTPQAPRKVSFADIEDAMRAAPDHAPVIGMGKHRKVIDVNLEDDSPHVLISAGSGGGKSVLAKSIIAQALNRGSRVVILDRKRVSHKWAKDLEGVEYYRDADQIHDVLVSLAKEGDRRNRLTDNDDDPDIGERIVIVYEEINATAAKLRNYWQEIRDKDDPKRSVAEEALSDLVNMGRQVKIHVVAIGQQVTARTLGGGEVRESFGTRCLARYSLQTWKMLCADVWPAPKKSAVRGRWQIVANGEATETQVAFLSDEEAQRWAGEGSTQADRAVGTAVGTDDLTTLKEAFGDDYDRRRKQLQRDKAGPEPVVVVNDGAGLYRRADLMTWVKQRDAAGTRSEGVQA